MSDSQITGRFTPTPAESRPDHHTSSRWLNRAARVISRLSSTTAPCAARVRQRINRTLAVMEQTEQTETAIVGQEQSRGVRRLAARVLRRIRFQ